MEMTKLSCEKFLAELASKAPTPGGGGTAALVGAAGARTPIEVRPIHLTSLSWKLGQVCKKY